MAYVHDYLSNEPHPSGHGPLAKVMVELEKGREFYPVNYWKRDRTKVDMLIRVIGSMGNTRASTKMVRPLLDTDADLIFLVGLAGSMDPSVRLGDVVIAHGAKTFAPDAVKKLQPGKHEVVIDHPTTSMGGTIYVDRQKVVMDEAFFRYGRDSARKEQSAQFINEYVEYAKSTDWRLTGLIPAEVAGLPSEYANPKPVVHMGNIFGSDMVIDSARYKKFVLDRNEDRSRDVYTQIYKTEGHERYKSFKGKLHAVDMESFGFFALAEELTADLGKAKLFSVRGISDMAEGKEDLDAATGEAVRGLAVRNAIKTTFDLMERVLGRLKGA
jgi:nucleoside phosphorylase